EPHGLAAVGFIGGGVGLDHEFPALPLIERGDYAVGGGVFAFAGAFGEKAVAPVFVHLGIDGHVHVIGVEIELAGRRIFAPGEPGLHAGELPGGAVGFEAGFAEGGPFVVGLVGEQGDEVVTVLVVGGELDVEAREDDVAAGHEPFFGFA